MSRPFRDHPNPRKQPDLPPRSFYREVTRRTPDNKETGSSASKNFQESSDRGVPLQQEHTLIPPEVLNEARDELREYMVQYTKSADPAEREARTERMRLAEEKGEMEETAIQMAKTALNASAERQRIATEEIVAEATPERVPATLRLGPPTHRSSTRGGKNFEASESHTHERIPASLRLGPVPPHILGQEGDDTVQEQLSGERLPATLRLGPVRPSSTSREKNSEARVIAKRKPGRPPGKKTAEKANQDQVPVTKKRRVTQKKSSPIRRKSSPKSTAPSKATARAGTSRGGDQTTSTTSSENRPICKMIPATVKKRMDFRIPSDPGP